MSRLCRLKSYKTIGDDGVWAYEEITSLRDQLAAAQAQIKVLRDALENCRLLAARYRKEEWAPHILRFCESGGSVANPLRQDDSALRELLKAERERVAQKLLKLGALGDGGYIAAIRAMEDQ